jgi:hypothetical protein
LTSVALAAAVGSAHADSGAIGQGAPQLNSVSTDIAPGIRYTDDLAANMTRVESPFGSLVLRAGQFTVRDNNGRTLIGSAPNALAAENLAAPATVRDSVAAVHGTAASAAVTPAAVAAPGDPVADLNSAVESADEHMGAAFGTGSIVGGALGILVGCPLGAVTGGSLTSLVTLGTMTLPAVIATCLAGATIAGAAGAFTGGVAFAIPVGIAAAADKYNQLQAEHAAASRVAAASAAGPVN